MTLNHSTDTAPKAWLDADDLANELGIPKRTIYKWRVEGKGPRGHKLGRHLRFSRENVDAWLAENIDPDTAA
ncbi:MAG: helix-turn-helix transcriptional regulator [Brevibacterium sp.]